MGSPRLTMWVQAYEGALLSRPSYDCSQRRRVWILLLRAPLNAESLPQTTPPALPQSRAAPLGPSPRPQTRRAGVITTAALCRSWRCCDRTCAGADPTLPRHSSARGDTYQAPFTGRSHLSASAGASRGSLYSV